MPDYQSNNQQQRQSTEVNTNGIVLFSADSTMLRLGYRGETMFISIIPKVNDPNGGRARWPRELSHAASLRPHQALSLYEGFKQKLLPDIAEKKDHPGSVVVPLNREASNLCGFSYAGERACFNIFNNVGPDRTCSESFSFIFEPTLMIDDYNPNTGAYTTFQVQGQLFVVAEALRLFGEYGTSAPGHGVRHASTWTNDMMMSYLRAVAAKVNAVPAQYGSYTPRTGNGDGFDRFGEGSSAGNAPLAGPGSGTVGDVTWGSAAEEAANVGHGAVTQVQQLSSLDDLMAGGLPTG